MSDEGNKTVHTAATESAPVASLDNGTGGMHSPPLASVSGIPVTMPMDARTLKARILSAKRFKSEIVDFFGEKIEIRQATLGRVLAQIDEDKDDDNTQKRGVYVLLNFAYVPGTQDLVFSDTDVEALMELPYGEDFTRVLTAYSKITGLDLAEATKN